MVYTIKLNIEGKLEEFKRTQPPFLKDITRALILQQHQIRMYSDEKGPTDAQFKKNSEEVAEFAVAFWNGQFQKNDVLSGADATAMSDISKAVDDALGTSDPDEIGNEEAKK